jgi:hypothetical protein
MQEEKPASKSKTPLLITIVALAVLIAFVAMNRDWLLDLFPSKKQAITETEPGWEEKLSALEKEGDETSDLSSTLTETMQDKALLPSEAAPEPAIPVVSEQEILLGKITAFFEYLDAKKYLADYELPETSMVHFKRTMDKLFANPPIVTREADDLFSILNNMAHFYRVLGRQEINLIRDIFANELGEMEEMMRLFYRWSELEGEKKSSGAGIDLPFTALYEYAGFFLNTLGGQAYLFRRDARIRLLVRYYSILVIDRANTLKVNRHGIDLRRIIDSTIDELEATRVLTRKDEYIDKLAALQLQYQTRYE